MKGHLQLYSPRLVPANCSFWYHWYQRYFSAAGLNGYQQCAFAVVTPHMKPSWNITKTGVQHFKSRSGKIQREGEKVEKGQLTGE